MKGEKKRAGRGRDHFGVGERKAGLWRCAEKKLWERERKGFGKRSAGPKRGNRGNAKKREKEKKESVAKTHKSQPKAL